MMGRPNGTRTVSMIAALLVIVPLVALAAEGIESLGFDKEQVELSLFGAMRGAYYAPDVPDAVREMSAEERKAAVQTLGAFAKSYYASTDFKKAYGEAYKNSKPKGFGLPSLKLKDTANTAEKSATDKLKNQSKPADSWKIDKDPKAQLKKGLQSFLTATADVDYAAATHSNGSLKIYDKAEYESKPREWKLCYRAGHETGEAIRAFAENWLAELK
jgi:hypothetical protein